MFLRVSCKQCGWGRAATDSVSSALTPAQILAEAQKHADETFHPVYVDGQVTERERK